MKTPTTVHESRNTQHGTRNTEHAPRSTLHAPRYPSPAFTLIELLTVIAIIALLAAMVFPITAAVNRIKIRSRTQAQLGQIETQIQLYKGKFGHYPPDNPNNKYVPPLYYELAGTSLNNGVYTTLDGSAKINAADVKTTFAVDGFVNCSKGGGGDEASGGYKLLIGLKPDQVTEATIPGAAPAKVLVGIPWQKPSSGNFSTFDPIPSAQGVNPWRYNSTNPTNNPSSYDLWIDVMIGGKVTRICNWSKQPMVVTTP